MKPKREEKQDFRSLQNPGIWGYRIHALNEGFSTSALFGFGVDDSLLWGAVLGPVGQLAAPLASTH